MDEYTPTEKAKLLEFRQLVSDISLTDNQTDDSFLIRWLRATNLNLKKAEEMLRKDILWRKENQVDGILDKEEEPEDLLLGSPFAWCGTTAEGYPILLEIRQDDRRFVEKYGKEVFVRFHIMHKEKICRQLEMESKKQGRKVTEIFQILDMNGYLSKLNWEFILELQDISDLHYPQLFRYAVIINAPTILVILFALLKPFMPKEILEKFDIYGPDKEKWRKAIREKFPIENIPTYWGGTLQGKDEFCSGSDIWFQGPQDLRPFMNGVGESDAEYSVTTVNARDRFTKEFHISQKHSIVEWKFKTESNDIGFQVKFHKENDLNDEEDIFLYARVDAHNSVQEGSYICDCPGKIQFIFDNTFSYVRSKKLLYKISINNDNIV